MSFHKFPIDFLDNANIGTNRQLDGAATDSSDEDASDLSEDNIDGEDDDDDLENEDEENDADGRPDEEPLNSEDDVTGSIPETFLKWKFFNSLFHFRRGCS